MKTILVDAVDCFVSDKGKIFNKMQELLDTYPNKKLFLQERIMKSIQSII